MSVNFATIGSGTIGPVQQGWRVQEDITPFVVGDSSGSVGQVSLSIGHEEDSEFILSNPSTFTHDKLGSISGSVTGIESSGSTEALDSTLTVLTSTALSSLSVERTANPVGTSFFDFSGYTLVPPTLSPTAYPLEMFVYPADESVSYIFSGAANTFYIQKVSLDGSLSTFTVTLSGLSYGQAPCGMVRDNVGNYYIGFVIAGVPRIYKFTSSGVFITSWGGSGTANGQFGSFLSTNSNPLHYNSQNDNIYVADSANNRVQQFSSSGVWVKNYTSPSVYAVTTDSSQQVYSASYDNVYRKFSAAGSNLITSQFFPRDHSEVVGIVTDAVGATEKILVLNTSDYSVPGVYVITEVESSDLSERRKWNFSSGVYGKRFSIGPTGLYVMGNQVIGGTTLPTPTRNYIYGNTRLLGAFSYYMALAGVYYLNWTAPNPSVTFRGWSGSVWDNLKQLCAAYAVELQSVNNFPTVRTAGSGNPVVIDNIQSGSARLSVGGQPSARAVKVFYNNAVAKYDELYSALRENKLISVNVGEFLSFELETNHYVSVVDSVGASGYAGSGNFSISDSTSPLALNVISGQFEAFGGSIKSYKSLTSPTSIMVEIRGPGQEIPGYVAPYKFAWVNDGGGVLPALKISGEAVFVNPQSIKLLTGASDSQRISDFGPDVNIPFINTLAQAYDRGIWASSISGGPELTLSMTIPTNAISSFGLFSGKRVSFKESIYRVSSMRIGNVATDLTLTRQIVTGDTSLIFSGKTTGQFQNTWANNKTSDFTIKPLRPIT